MHVASSGGSFGGPLRVSPSEVAALGGEVGLLRDAAGGLRATRALVDAAAAVPGGSLSPACHALAERWDRELRGLTYALSFIADALRAAATGYDRTDQANARGFGGSPAPPPDPGTSDSGIPARGGSAW